MRPRQDIERAYDLALAAGQGRFPSLEAHNQYGAMCIAAALEWVLTRDSEPVGFLLILAGMEIARDNATGN